MDKNHANTLHYHISHKSGNLHQKTELEGDQPEYQEKHGHMVKYSDTWEVGQTEEDATKMPLGENRMWIPFWLLDCLLSLLTKAHLF